MSHRLNVSTGHVDGRADHHRRYEPLELEGPFPGHQSNDAYEAFETKLEVALGKGLNDLTEAEQHLAWTVYRGGWADSYMHQLRVAVERQRRAS